MFGRLVGAPGVSLGTVLALGQRLLEERVGQNGGTRVTGWAVLTACMCDRAWPLPPGGVRAAVGQGAPRPRLTAHCMVGAAA